MSIFDESLRFLYVSILSYFNKNFIEYCLFKRPCQNNGICRHADKVGYICECLPGYEGDQCQYDQRLCRIECFGQG
jgi:hypothetical protein